MIITLDESSAIEVPVLPVTVLIVVEVGADIYSPGGFLHEAGAVEDAAEACKLCELPLFDRERLNDPLLPLFFAMLEGAQLHDLVVEIDEDTESMGLKLLVDIEELTPVSVASELAGEDIVVLHIFRSWKEIVIHEKLDAELEWLEFLDAVGDVIVDLGYLSLYLLQ